MAKVKRINARGRHTRKLAKEAAEYLKDGYQVVFDLGESPRPKRVLQFLNDVAGSKKTNIVIKDPRFRAYLKSAAEGAAIGAAPGIATIVTKLAAGAALSLPSVLQLVLIPAAVGAFIGLLTKSLHVTVYSYAQVTYIRFAKAA